ncbi:MAG TPA: YncE family protein [Thermoanaerobaculia bacterium]|nr:YncE family protein [Thermoanaerobaculia bacterium]
MVNESGSELPHSISGKLPHSKDERNIMRNTITILALLLTALALAAATPSTPAPNATPAGAHYHVVRHIPIGGEGGWDYLTADSATHRLFISHATHVVVLDTESGKVVGDIPKTDGVHGIALAPELGKGFISNGRSSTMTIFDLKTLATTGEVKTVSERPDAILYDPFSKRVFTFNAGGKNATAFDAATSAVAGTVDLGGKPEFATTDGAGRVFVNIEDKGEIAVIDAKKLTVTARWPLAPCTDPSGMAIDVAGHRLFSGCGNQLMAIVDAGSGKVVQTVPIGKGVDANVYDAKLALAFSSNGDGTLTVVKRSKDAYEVVENAPTARGARTMALDDKTHHIFFAIAQFGPPPPATPERPNPRPTMVPGTFEILEVAP